NAVTRRPCDLMSHRQRDIGLVVTKSGGLRDRPSRHDLFDEGYTPANLVAACAANVEPQVHLLKVAMQRHGHAEDPRIQKQESDEADKGLAVMKIKLAAARNKQLEHRRLDLPIEHCQQLPAGREKHAVERFGLGSD